MIKHKTKIIVRYSETDQMGYAYYGNYAAWYEVGRTEALRSLGSSYKKMEDSGVMMPVVEMNSRYIKPAKYDDELTITTVVGKLPSIRMRFDYFVENSEGVLLNKGFTDLVFVDMKTNKLMKAPKFLIDLLSPHFS